jgi:YgiT-type zinc finger domain-containing protein
MDLKKSIGAGGCSDPERPMMPSEATCAACGSACEERAITLALPRSDNGLAIIRNVPAEVCTECGETRFSLQTTGTMMNLVHGENPPDAVAVVPIYDLGNAAMAG